MIFLNLTNFGHLFMKKPINSGYGLPSAVEPVKLLLMSLETTV